MIAKFDQKKMLVSKYFLFQILFSVIFLIVIFTSFNNAADLNSLKIFSFFALFMLIYHIFFLIINGTKIISFEMWFIILSYLFMFGQIFLVGVFGLENIESLGYVRPVLDSRYSLNIIYNSSLFVLTCIHFIFIAFLFTNKKEFNEKKDYLCDNTLFRTSKVLLLIGIPCHLIYSFRMIIAAQTVNSYDGIMDYTGLIDDFSNFMIYGLVCLFFSGKIDKKKSKIILLVSIAYLLFVMIMTGDRRYQIVGIITLFLSYVKIYDIKIFVGIKGLFTALFSYFILGLFYLIREIRSSSLFGLVSFIETYNKVLFNFDTNIISQTFYEFGGSFYTVCLAFKYVPSLVNYKYGGTIFSGILSIIPFGFLIKDSELFLNGRLASELMSIGNTTVGGSVYADLFGNFGLIGGIIAAFVLGIIFNNLFYTKTRNNMDCYYLARYYILFFALLHLVRASFTEVIRTSVWGLFALFVIYKLMWREKSEN